MQCTKSVIFTALLTTLVVGGVSYTLLHKDIRVPNITPTAIQPFVGDVRPNGKPTVPANTQPVATSTLSYYIPEMGVHFEYPTYATVTVDILKGAMGNLLAGTIHLSHDQNTPSEVRGIIFSGLTPDYVYPKPMTSDITDTTGYHTDGDGLYDEGCVRCSVPRRYRRCGMLASHCIRRSLRGT